jgi:hypothetical protein
VDPSPVTRHPSPVTRHPSPVTRHPWPRSARLLEPQPLSHGQAVDLDIPVSAADYFSDVPDTCAVKNGIHCSGGCGFRPIFTPPTKHSWRPHGHTVAATL